MNLRLLLFFCCSLIGAAVGAQGFEWAARVGGGGWESGRGLALDDEGHVYLTGDFEQSVVFGAGADAVTLTATGARDIFFAKYAPEGQLLWVRRIGGPNLDFCQAIATGNDGSVFIAGFFEGSVDFDPGPGEAILNSAGDVDIFWAKYTPQGEYVWAYRIGNDDVNVANGLALGPDGGLYICGFFYGSMDFDPNPQAQALRASNGSSDIFLAKYEQSSGALLWARSMGGVNIEEAVAVRVDGVGSVLLGGNYNGAFDFDPNGGGVTLPTYGQQDIFFAKFLPDGNLLWARGVGSPFGNDGLRDVAYDAQNNILICGFYRDQMDVNPLLGIQNLTHVALTDAFVAKYTPAGILSWAKGLSSVGANEAWTVHADEADNVHVGGFFSASTDFNPGGTPAALASAGKQDGFMARYSAQGAHIWSGALRGADDIAAFGSLWAGGSFYLTGRFRGLADFDPGPESYELNSEGNFDLFLAKYAACPGFEAVVAADSVSCFGGSDGSALASAAGGSPPFQYVWNPGQQSGPQLSGVVAGSYTVLITDAANCALTRQAQIGEPAPLLAAVVLQNSDASCNGALEATPEGGVPPYSAMWSNGVVGNVIANLCPGVYTLTVTDNNNCQMIQSYTVELIMSDGVAPAPAPALRLWPQPAHSELWISADEAAVPLRWEVCDAAGRAMSVRIQRAASGAWRLDLSGYTPGAYVLRAWSGREGHGAWRFIVR